MQTKWEKGDLFRKESEGMTIEQILEKFDIVGG